MVIVMDGEDLSGSGKFEPQRVGYMTPFDEAVPDRRGDVHWPESKT
jgi:hypothetical protein